MPHYPYFVHIPPSETPGVPGSVRISGVFQEQDRNYDSMLRWMLDSAKGLKEKSSVGGGDVKALVQTQQ